MISGRDALARLRSGNQRFAAGEPLGAALADQARRAELVEGQEPIAIVLGCSDSRVPVEIVFGQGVGDLFVVRVAGNVAGSPQIGSVEFAAEKFGTRLVVVLGHTRCGAVAAALEGLEQGGERLSDHLATILAGVRPAVESVRRAHGSADRDDLLRAAVRANVRSAAERLRQESQILARLGRDEGLLIVGAEYALETGVVDFFAVSPAAGSGGTS